MRCALLVLDGVGIGQLPDASQYNDSGSNTLANLAQATGGLHLPVLEKLGLGNIIPIKGVKAVKNPSASFGKCAELSAGKDTMTGHWEIMGVHLDKAFPVYPNGFPPKIIEPFEQEIRTKIIGNKPASGTEIIEELGQEHLKTGYPIVYTSADSVFQIAAHPDKINLKKLYGMCEIAAEMLLPKQKVSRIIARPFAGSPGAFLRTTQRKDYTIAPPGNILDKLVDSSVKTVGVGKISEIFAGRGINKSFHGSGNDELMELTVREFTNLNSGFVFTNLADFDTLWGHRNNPQGFSRALSRLDSQLSALLNILQPDDILFITADHGCDPTTKSTDHSREYIPLLVAGQGVKPGVDLGTRKTFADIGQTIAGYFKVKFKGIGQSFLSELTSARHHQNSAYQK